MARIDKSAEAKTSDNAQAKVDKLCRATSTRPWPRKTEACRLTLQGHCEPAGASGEQYEHKRCTNYTGNEQEFSGRALLPSRAAMDPFNSELNTIRVCRSDMPSVRLFIAFLAELGTLQQLAQLARLASSAPRPGPTQALPPALLHLALPQHQAFAWWHLLGGDMGQRRFHLQLALLQLQALDWSLGRLLYDLVRCPCHLCVHCLHYLLCPSIAGH